MVVRVDRHARRPDDVQDREIAVVMKGRDLGLAGRAKRRLYIERIRDDSLQDLSDCQLG